MSGPTLIYLLMKDPFGDDLTNFLCLIKLMELLNQLNKNIANAWFNHYIERLNLNNVNTQSGKNN